MDVPHIASAAFARSVPGTENATCDQHQPDRLQSSMLVLSEVRSGRQTLIETPEQAFCFSEVRSPASIEETVSKQSTVERALVLVGVARQSGLAATGQLRVHDLTTRLIAINMDDVIQEIAALNQDGIVARGGRSGALNEVLEGIVTLLSDRLAADCSVTARPGSNVGATKNCPDRAAGEAAAPLTAREHQVVRLIIAGDSNKEIARALGVSVATVKSHVHNLLGKLGLAGRGKLAVWYEGRVAAADATLRETGR
jgi:two-component system, NarL family, nitrate/nitrite response regulator NarL